MAFNIHQEFAFREMEAGPRRDTGKRFAEMAYDLDSELGGPSPQKDHAMKLLLVARNEFVNEVAGRMVRARDKVEESGD